MEENGNHDKKTPVEIYTNIIEAEQKEYDERYKTWSAKALEQLSFTNNLIITLSVAFLGFLFSSDNAQCFNKYFYIAIIIVCGISIFFGILATISRLYDFKITRNITLIRKVYFKKNNKEKDKGKLPPSQKIKSSLSNSVYAVLEVFFFDINNLNKDMLDLKENFKERSKLSNALGNATWRFFKYQIGFFLISIFLYSILYIIFFILNDI